MLSLIHALLQHFQSFLLADPFIPVLVHRTQRNIDTKTLSGVWDFSLRSVEIDKVSKLNIVASGYVGA